jgi:hypothetical protein
MLDNNNHKNTNCAFAEQGVSYLYGEITAEEKSVFETHLQCCNACAEEFAGFKTIHSSLIEWRNAEFLPLETPAIEIPYEKTRKFYHTENDSTVSRPWFEELRRIFSLSPLLTAFASFAIITICLGIVFFANKTSTNVEVATSSEKTEQINSPKAVEENLADTATNVDLEKDKGENSFNAKSTVVAKNNNQKEFSDSRKDSVVKVSDVPRIAAKNLNAAANSHKVKTPSYENKNPTFARTNKLPRLNNVEEYEDKSLRLAELFEDEGGK